MLKFSSVNQKVMGVYVEAQTAINQKRMAEVEAQMKQAQAAELAQNLNKISTDVSASPDDLPQQTTTISS